MKEEVFSQDGGGAVRFARRLALGSIVVLAFAALGAASLQAAKPPPPPPPGGGTIYYTVGQGLWSMNSDGSGKTLLPFAGEPSAVPSRLLHGGYRWFLQRRQVGTYPNGMPHREIFAVRGDGNEAFTRQLSDSPVVEPLEATAPIAWQPGDVGISMAGRLWDWQAGGDCLNPQPYELNPCVVEGGIYGIDVHFDASGNVDSLPADPGAPIVAVDLWLYSDDTRPNVAYHDWSPDGGEIVHQYKPPGPVNALKVVVVATGEVRILEGDGGQPRWSPDGSRISFQRYNTIYTIAPDGSSLTQILAGSGLATVFGARWSPTGSHVTYTRATGSILGGTYASDVYRATASGGTRTNLTADVAGEASPANWR